jgi:ribosomal protein S18 acetylase RimI-like enzyme
MNSIFIERAVPADADDILRLYRSLVGTPYCTWDDEYPDREIVENDLRQYKVFVVRDNGSIIAAAVSAYDASLDPIASWCRDVRQWALLTRLGVSQPHQNRGIARQLVRFIMADAKADGCDGIRFLVSPDNHPAQRMYQSIGFDICGEADHYEMNWLCYQKRLI